MVDGEAAGPASREGVDGLGPFIMEGGEAAGPRTEVEGGPAGGL